MTSPDAELAGETACLDGWRDETGLFGATGCWAR